MKSLPKNGHVREVFINDRMMEILKRRLAALPAGCPFVFEHKGKPLLYASISASVNKAWKDAALPQFSGTHLMRYAAAQLSRKLMGNIDSAKAVTGHRSLALVEKYSDVNSVEKNRAAVKTLDDALGEIEPAA